MIYVFLRNKHMMDSSVFMHQFSVPERSHLKIHPPPPPPGPAITSALVSSPMPTETLAVETQAPAPQTQTQTQTPTTTASSSPSSTHRRHRTFSSSSSSSSSLSTLSSAASSPSPSPRGRAVPFSWEHHPGIPKVRFLGGAGAASSAPTPLPLPPPLRVPETSRARHQQHARRRRACGKPMPADDAGGDPFAAALAECTRERGGAGSDAGLMDALFPARPTTSSSVPSSRRWSIASAGGVVGLLDLYGCRSVVGVAEGAFVVRRPVKVVRAVPAGRAGMGRAGRR